MSNSGQQSDQHGTRWAVLLICTASYQGFDHSRQGESTSSCFYMTSVYVENCSWFFFSISFSLVVCAVPLGHTSVDCKAIKESPYQPVTDAHWGQKRPEVGVYLSSSPSHRLGRTLLFPAPTGKRQEGTFPDCSASTNPQGLTKQSYSTVRGISEDNNVGWRFPLSASPSAGNLRDNSRPGRPTSPPAPTGRRQYGTATEPGNVATPQVPLLFL